MQQTLAFVYSTRSFRDENIATFFCLFAIGTVEERRVGCFRILPSVNNAAVNREMHMSFQIYVWGFFR